MHLLNTIYVFLMELIGNMNRKHVESCNKSSLGAVILSVCDWMFMFTFSLSPSVLSDVCRRSEHFSSWMRRSRLWMQLLSTRMKPSLRDRDSWGLLPACSPSGRWTSWPNSVICLPLRPELCCASTSTRSVSCSTWDFTMYYKMQYVLLF